jgi:hypothetical protein
VFSVGPLTLRFIKEDQMDARLKMAGMTALGMDAL